MGQPYRIEQVLKPNIKNCNEGWAYVRIRDIPAMTNQNKDNLNKQILFALVDKDNTNFIAVYHRYLQPDWPEGDWWPTWRMESGGRPEHCRKEYNIWNSSPLEGSDATFGVAWNDNNAWVMNMDTGHLQHLIVPGILGIHRIATKQEMVGWGTNGVTTSTYELTNIGKQRKGEPYLCI